MSDSDLRAAIAELYARDPDGFAQRRRELAARARAAGDRSAAQVIAALRKPTRTAWVVNALVWADPTVPERLAELAARLRAGEAELDGARIRALSLERRQLLQAMTDRALAQAGVGQAPASLREEVTATFGAAIADPQVAEQLASGTLLRAARWAGFSPAIGTAAPPAVGPATLDPAAPAGSAHAQPETAAERELREAIGRAKRAVALAQSDAAAAAAAAREREETVSALRARLGEELRRADEASRAAREAEAALEAAREQLGRLTGPDRPA